MDLNRILLDIETQRDLFLPKGAGYAPDAGKAAPRIYKLFDWAKREEIPVLSTALRVRPGRIGPFADAPHLIEGTEGERKLPRTLLPRHVDLGLRNDTDLPANLFGTYQQVIFEKRDTDILSHAKAERLITELPLLTFVICGAGVADGVVEAAVGLRNRGFSVVLAEDAVADFGDERADMAYLRMKAKGVAFVKTSEIIEPCVQRPAGKFRESAYSRRT